MLFNSNPFPTHTYIDTYIQIYAYVNKRATRRVIASQLGFGGFYHFCATNMLTWKTHKNRYIGGDFALSIYYSLPERFFKIQ